MSFSKVSLALLAMGGWVFAAPTGHEVTRGSADVQAVGNGALHIHADDQSVIQWQEFSIGKGELVKFIQPHEKASVVNQVVSNRLSEIYGTLEANGHVYLINPAGIVVGKEGVIHAAGFIASTFDFTETKEGMLFKGSSRAKIENYGTIQTSHGDVFLIGYQVLNEGKIGGDEVRVGQGLEILLKPEGKERLFVKLGDKEHCEGVGIENRGTIEALKTELKADGNAFSYAIKNDGLIEGNRLYSEGGEIYLVAEGGRVAQNGTIRSEGGEVALLGHTLVLNEGSHIDVSHDTAPGKVFVGGNGKDETLMIARQAYFSKGAKISADARVKGDGGRVIVYSADYTGYFGEASVRSGIEGGDGGFVEASGRLGLHFAGAADVNAPRGENGMLYIDPTDININAGPTSGSVVFPPLSGTVTFNVAGSPVSIAAAAIVTHLNTNGNLTIDTAAAITSGAAGVITVTQPVIWNSANSLTLLADSNIDVQNRIFNSGTGPVTVISGGNVLVGPPVANTRAEIASAGGLTTVEATCGDIIIQGGTASAEHAMIGPFAGASTGNVIARAGNDIRMTGGQGAGFNQASSAIIGKLGPGQLVPGAGTASGDIFVTAGRDIVMVGGPAPNAGGANIGIGMGFPTGNDTRIGDVFVNVGRNIDMSQGTEGGVSIAGIKASGNASLYQGDFFVNVGRNLYMHQNPAIGTGFASAFIGGSNYSTREYVQNVFVNVGENLTMDARDGGFVTFQTFNTVGDFATQGFTRIHVGGDVTLLGGNAGTSPQCYILLHHARMTTEVWANGNIRCFNGTAENAIIGLPFANGGLFNNNGDLGILDVRAGGNLIMGGGSPAPSPGNDQVFNSQTQYVYLQADAPFGTGQLWPAQFVASPCTGANIFAGTPLAAASGNQSTTNPSIVGGDGLGGFAIDAGEYNFPNATTVNGPTWNNSNPTAPAAPVLAASRGLSYSAETGLSILSRDRFADGTPCDFLIGDRNTPNAMELLCRNGNVTVDQFRDIVIQPRANLLSPQNPTTVFSGDVLIIANNDITMDPGAQITSANNLTLVVDNQAPVAPQIGGVWSPAGRFLMDQTASLVSNTSGSGGLLSVYTALQAANSILGTLNGALFFPGTRFVNTDTEEWCVYYPGGTTGPIFTIFYKPCAPFVSVAQLFISELFFDLHSPDEYLGWPEEFKFIYNDIRKNTMWERFNHREEENHYLRRKYYYMNNPKSYRDFVELYEKF